MQLEPNDLIHIFLFRKVAIHTVIFDTLWQAMTWRTQLLLVKINPRLFFFLRRGVTGWRLRHGQREGAAVPHRDDREGGNLQPAFGATGATVEERAETKSLLAALGNERSILSRDHFRERTDDCGHDLLMKDRPVKRASELSCNGALGVVTVAREIAKVDATAQCEDGGKQNFKELALWLTKRRHLFQDVWDNCHRPLTVERGFEHSHSTSSWPFSLISFSQKNDRSIVSTEERTLRTEGHPRVRREGKAISSVCVPRMASTIMRIAASSAGDSLKTASFMYWKELRRESRCTKYLPDEHPLKSHQYCFDPTGARIALPAQPY